MQKGLSLIETSVVLVLSAIVVSMCVFYYNHAAESKKMQDSLELLQVVNSSVQKIYASSKISAGGTTFVESIAAANNIKTVKVAGTVKIAFPIGGFLEMWGENRTFYMEVQDFTKSECMRLGMTNLGTSMQSPPLIFKGQVTSDSSTEFSMSKTASLCETVGNRGKIRFALNI